MNEPLAQRMRPKTLAEVCGQQHLLAPGRVFRRTIESGRIPNMIFYGPSGTGKTTVARIIAENSGMTLHKLNGTSCGTGDIKAVLKDKHRPIHRKELFDHPILLKGEICYSTHQTQPSNISSTSHLHGRRKSIRQTKKP